MPYVTCDYCRSLILRDGDETRVFGEVAALPFDMSPIQLGTRWVAAGMSFTVVGRVRWGWEAGSWNEWLALGDDGVHRWLAEAMGQFLFSEERPDLLTQHAAEVFTSLGALTRGGTMMLDEAVLTVTDVKQAHCLGAEGDLPFPAIAGRTMVSVDFRGAAGQAISLQRDDDGVTAWAGHWHLLRDFTPTNLRVIAGWQLPEGTA